MFLPEVTRRSLRRLGSTDSLSELESRADTPTLALRGNKKLNTIAENGKENIQIAGVKLLMKNFVCFRYTNNDQGPHRR